MKAGELFVQLGVKADTITVKEFATAIGELPLNIAGAIAGLAGINVELVSLANEAMNAAVGFQLFENQTGLSAQALQGWQIAAQQANVSADAVTHSVTALQRNMAEIQLGRGNIAPFQMLGIDPRQDAFHVLDQLRGKIKGLSPAMATNFLSQMGIDPSMINVLKLSDAEFGRLSHTIHGINLEQEKTFLRTKQSLVQLSLVVKEFGFDFVEHILKGFQMFMDYMRTSPVAIKILIGSIALLAAAFAPVTAAVVGLLLLIDDLAVYAAGGDSLFGDMIQGLKKMGDEMGDFLNKKGLGQLAMIGQLAMGALPVVGPLAQTTTGRTINQSINMTVHGTGSSEDTAHHVVKKIKEAATLAATLLDNQGF